MQGSSNARYVASRLIPAHRDSTEEQEAQVPVLGMLTEEQLANMLSRQLPTEEASLLQWCRSVGVEPPPPPDNVTDALEGNFSSLLQSLNEMEGVASECKAFSRGWPNPVSFSSVSTFSSCSED